MKPSDQDPHCFPLRLKVHSYNWNAEDKNEKKNWRSEVHKNIQHDKGKLERDFLVFSGAKFRPHSQWNLGDCFSNFEKNPNL